jgi:2,4-dienoyl-CoA reductase-like NADH-dependent reductase (Old Yellow Enzyme family)
MVVDKDEIVDDLRKVSKVAHEYDAKIVAQLNHGGHVLPRYRRNACCASAVRDKSAW